MLGLGRASQWAGWWSQGLRASIQSLFITQAQGQVRPRFAADYQGTSTIGQNPALMIWLPTTDYEPIDLSGAGTDIRRGVRSFTFWVGDDWAQSTPSGFNRLTGDYTRWTNLTDEYFTNLVILGDDPTIILTGNSFGVDISESGWPMAWRNQWLTLILATSDNPADFSGWTGPSTNTWNYYGRFMLTSMTNQEVLGTWDAGAFQAPPAIDLELAWEFASNPGPTDVAVSKFHLAGSNQQVTQDFDLQDIRILNSWESQGQGFDPAVYWPELSTASPGLTIAGIRPLCRTIMTNAGTAFGTPTRGYTQVIPQGQNRIPECSVQIQVDDQASPLVPPEFRDIY
jgi:hypothetical protein